MVSTNKIGINFLLYGFLFFTGSPLLGNDNTNLFFYTDGVNVTDYLTLAPQTMTSLWSNGRSGAYEIWGSPWQMPTKYGTISFSALASNDITIGISSVDPRGVISSGTNLYSNLTNSSNMYEIVIGGWGNGNSAIRQGAQTNPVKFVARGIPRNHEGNAIMVPISYKIIFYRNPVNNKDTVAVYVLHPRSQNWRKLMAYHGSEFSDGPRWFSLSSWDTNIFYADIIVSDSTDIHGAAR